MGKLVSYHIDYAEVVRHQTGIVTPPIYGAVVHCSDFRENPMTGGDFAVNLRGLAHYQEWGYKAANKSRDNADFCEVEAMCEEGSQHWRRVQYKHRRTVYFDGDSPHMATPIESIAPGCHRVIVGINVFGHNVGWHAARFPDHAARSNRVVKMLQAFGGRGGPSGADKLTREILSKVARAKGWESAAGAASEEEAGAVLVQRYQPEHQEAALEIFKKGLMEYAIPGSVVAKMEEEFFESSYKSDMHNIQEYYMNSPDRCFWVALLDAQVVGIVAGVTQGSTVQLQRMSVMHEYRGKGAGTLLVQAVLHWAREREGVSKVILPTDSRCCLYRFVRSICLLVAHMASRCF